MLHPGKKILSYKNIPILLSCTKDSARLDRTYNFELYLNQKNGVVTQLKIPPQEILYKYARNSAVGKTWYNHNLAFLDFIKKTKLYDKTICEIGSGSGTLARIIGKDFPIDCYEPSPTFDETENIKVIKSFFTAPIKKYDIVILSHTFEHLPDIDSFLRLIHCNLKPDGKIIISVPNFLIGLKKKFINMLSPEHVSYFTPKSLEKALNLNGFQNCKIYLYNDHSIFIQGTKSEKFSSNVQTNNKQIVLLLNNYRKAINKKIITAKRNIKKYKNKKIFLFGCTGMASMFLYYSKLNKQRISGILDNDPLKNGLRLYGTHLICNQPTTVNGDIVLLNGSTYHAEIEKTLIHYGYKIISWK